MSITVEWANPERTILLESFEGRWTWEEFYEVCGKQAPAMIREVDHGVYIISDFRQSGPLPLGGAISQARTVMKNLPDNWEMLIVVSSNSLVLALVSVFSHAYSRGIGSRVYAAKTMEEAHGLIAAQAGGTGA